MHSATASLLLSVTAIVLSALAVRYTRRQAKAGEDQVTQARRAADIAESSSRDAKATDVERRFRDALTIEISGRDPINLMATVKSTYPERVAEFAIALLPVAEEPQIGFKSEDDGSLESSWTIYRLAPGDSMTRPVADLRKDSPNSVDVRFNLLEDGLACSWTSPLKISYPPSVHFF